MKWYQKISFIFVLALAFCLSAASDAQAYFIQDGVHVIDAGGAGGCGSVTESWGIRTSDFYMNNVYTGSTNCTQAYRDTTISIVSVTNVTIVASTTQTASTNCSLKWMGSDGSYDSQVGSALTLSSGISTTTKSVVGAYGDYFAVGLGSTGGGAGKACYVDILDIQYDGVSVMNAPPPPPSPTTPVPMAVFQENFDGASTTAGTNIVNTWGQVGWLQTGSGLNGYVVTATGTAPSSPNIIYTTGSKRNGFYVATSSKIQFGGEFFMGTASDLKLVLYAEGVTGTNFSGTSTLNMTICTRTSCGLGAPQVNISSSGSFFSCTAESALSAYTGNSWETFEFLYDADNGSIQLWVGDEEFSTICAPQEEIESPMIAFGSGALDNLYLATDGYIYVPPTPTWGLGTTTVYGYSDFYETRFTGVTVTPSGTSSADFNISYYIDAQEIVPNVLERYPELVTVRYSVGTSSIVAGQSGAVSTSTLISGGYATTTIDVTNLADGSYVANIQFDNYACAARRAGLSDSNGIPVCPFPLAQANVTFLMVSGVPYVAEVSLIDNSPNINDETGEEETTDLMSVFTRFFVEVFTEKHPFAWYNDFLQLVQQASQIEYESEDLEFSIPIFVAVTNSSSTMEFLDFTDAKEAVDGLDYDDDYQPIERGCELFNSGLPAFDFCAFARTMSAYTLYVGLFVLLGFMMYRFFMSDNNAT